jgi:hypothetical protein
MCPQRVSTRHPWTLAKESLVRKVQQAKCPLARRGIIAGVVAGVLAAFMAGPAPRLDQARAEALSPAARTAAPQAAETWVCTDATFEAGRFPLELSLQDGVLSEQPLGLPRYRLLANTPYAIIGEDHFGDFDPVLGMPSIFMSAILIDRVTGSFTATTALAGGTPHQRTGRCRRFEAQAPASDGVLARR